jgi:hypothetical protein
MALKTTKIMDAIRAVEAGKNWCDDAEGYIRCFLKLETLDREDCRPTDIDPCTCTDCTALYASVRSRPLRFTLAEGQAKTITAGKFRIAMETAKRLNVLSMDNLNDIGRRVLGDEWNDFAREYRVTVTISVEPSNPDAGLTPEDVRVALDAGAFRDLDVYAF